VVDWVRRVLAVEQPQQAVGLDLGILLFDLLVQRVALVGVVLVAFAVEALRDSVDLGDRLRREDRRPSRSRRSRPARKMNLAANLSWAWM
jgi:hypothetical protein